MRKLLCTFRWDIWPALSLAISYSTIAIVMCYSDNKEIFLGFPQAIHATAVNHTAIALWMMRMATPVTGELLLLARVSRMSGMTLIRVRSHKHYCNFVMWKVSLSLSLWFVIQGLSIFRTIHPVADAIRCVLLLLGVDFMWMMIVLVAWHSRVKTVVGPLVVCMCGLTCLVCEFVPNGSFWLPGCWGMLCRVWPNGAAFTMEIVKLYLVDALLVTAFFQFIPNHLKEVL